MTAEGPALRASVDDRPLGRVLPFDSRPDGPEPGAEDARERPERRRGHLRATLVDLRFRPNRRHLGLVVVALVALWLVLVFSRAVTDAAAVNQDAAAVREQISDLRTRLDEADREVATVQSDAFVRHRARAFGMGEPEERAFSLEPDAPPPRAIRPLGAAPDGPARTPLEDWLRVLFGD